MVVDHGLNPPPPLLVPKGSRQGLDLRLFEFIMNCHETRERSLNRFAAFFREREMGFGVLARVVLTAVKLRNFLVQFPVCSRA